MMAKPLYWVKSGPANQIPSTKKYSQIPNTCSQRKPEEKQGKDEPERRGYFQSIGARDTGWEHFTHRTLSQVKDRTHKSPTILSEGTHIPNAKLKLPMRCKDTNTSDTQDTNLMKKQTLKQILKVYQIPNGNFQKQHWSEAFNTLDAGIGQGPSI